MKKIVTEDNKQGDMKNQKDYDVSEIEINPPKSLGRAGRRRTAPCRQPVPLDRQGESMKKMLLALIVFALILPGGCGGEKGPLNFLPENGVILAFGDSLTYGTGAAAGQSYPEVLERITGRRVVRSGVPGEETEAGLKRLPSVLDAVRPDLVILCHGGNDLLRRRDLRRTAENLKTMIAIIRNGGAQVVLIGVPALGLGLRTSPVYKTVAEETKTPYLADTLTEILSSGDLKADYIHPNGKGYARMAAAIADFLVQQGAFLKGDLQKALLKTGHRINQAAHNSAVAGSPISPFPGRPGRIRTGDGTRFSHLPSTAVTEQVSVGRPVPFPTGREGRFLP